MATIQLADANKTVDVVKRAFFLAWKECGGTRGSGFMQDRPSADEADVWRNVETGRDYPGNPHGVKERGGKSEVYGDYVFGRMMKLGFHFNTTAGTIEVHDSKPRGDYQGWSGERFPTYASLIETAAKELGAEIAPLAATPA